VSRASAGPALVTAVGLLLAIAGTLAPSEEATALGSPATRLVVVLPDWIVIATVAALAAASCILLASILPRPRPRRKKGEEPYELYYEPRKVPPIIVMFLLVLALTPPGILAASILWLDRNEGMPYGQRGNLLEQPHQASPRRLGQPADTDDRPRRSSSAVTTGLLGALAVLAGFGSLGLMLWLRYGGRLARQPFDDERSRGPLAAAVDESIEDLRLEPDTRVAIIKCYRRFERALAAAELPRPPWQTPVEFMRAALSQLPLPAAAVASLTELFEIARFSQHTVGPEERENAWQSLVDIREALLRRKGQFNATSA
jgi:hypothetical protein